MKKALGKGLSALLPVDEDSNRSFVVQLPIQKIEPNPGQPRQHFDDESLDELAASIKEVGVISPIIVTDEGDYYKIIAGERRWRASRLCGLKEIPAIIRRDLAEEQSLEIALIENIQREDLNPLEEAQGYEKLITEYHYTQEKISQVVGKSRPVVANNLRLLKLPEEVRKLLLDGRLSPGHARAVLSFNSEQAQIAIAKEILEKDLTVRQVEKAAKQISNIKNVPTAEDSLSSSSATSSVKNSRQNEREQNLRKIEDLLKSRFGTNVAFKSHGKKGCLIIEYYDDDDLQRILDKLGMEL